MIAVLLERGSVIVRHHLDEAPLCREPVVEESSGDGRLRTPFMFFEQAADGVHVVGAEMFEADELRVAALAERAFLVEDVCDAPAHPRCEVPSGAADDDDDAAGHVLTAVIA